MTFQEFSEQLLPLDNHLNANAAMGGLLFETYGEEKEFVKRQPVENVWTVVECEDDLMEEGQESEVLEVPTIWMICPGYHHVNRIGYIITNRPVSAHTDEFIEY